MTANLALALVLPEETETPVQQWKKELQHRLLELVEALSKYNQARKKVSGFVSLDSRTALDTEECIEEIINDWITAQCEKTSNEAKNNGHLNIGTDYLPGDVADYRFPRKTGAFKAHPQLSKKYTSDLSGEQLVAYAMEKYDFERLERSLKEAAQSIEEDGYKDAAEKLAREFSLANFHGRHGDDFEIKQQKGRYILEVSNRSWSNSDRVRSLFDCHIKAQTFEAETGVSGLSHCFRMLSDMENSLTSYDHIVSSRTKVCEGEPVEAVFYLEKIKLHFLPEVFEALIGFVGSYSNSPLKNMVFK